ncbi:hypothetical protein P7K49_005923 [Saguinus oedipus]|uniref:Uncharacterized protein n=1 Tax=Saguinus oedipus TaxID=9490 RepID=A0ABQ9W4I8_SAGOE|nr:hypothetical protein P7K49_005923 [Saguinus oedipus]
MRTQHPEASAEGRKEKANWLFQQGHCGQLFPSPISKLLANLSFIIEYPTAATFSPQREANVPGSSPRQSHALRCQGPVSAQGSPKLSHPQSCQHTRPSPFHDLGELHPSQELIVLADFSNGPFKFTPVFVDQPLPFLCLLTAALFSSKLEAAIGKPLLRKPESVPTSWPEPARECGFSRVICSTTEPADAPAQLPLSPVPATQGDAANTHTLTSRGVNSFSGMGLLFSQASGR